MIEIHMPENRNTFEALEELYNSQQLDEVWTIEIRSDHGVLMPGMHTYYAKPKETVVVGEDSDRGKLLEDFYYKFIYPQISGSHKYCVRLRKKAQRSKWHDVVKEYVANTHHVFTLPPSQVVVKTRDNKKYWFMVRSVE